MAKPVPSPRSPDHHGAGLTGPADALRYDGHWDDPCEVAGLMRKLMPAGVSVLDIGCGAGGLTLIVNRDKGNRVLAIEPDEGRAKAAREKGLTVEHAELDEAFFRGRAPFDVIILADVLEHLPAPAAALELAMTGLRPNGMLLLSVPNVAHWSVRANLLFGKFDYEPAGIMDSTHLRWFTAKSLQGLLQSVGFRVDTLEFAAGTTLPVYDRGAFKLIRRQWLDRAIRIGTRLFPRLFASQFVVVARPVPGQAKS